MRNFNLLILIAICTILYGCADTAAPYEQQQQSRNLNDQDFDGVVNARDECADTPIGAIIDNKGCSITEVAFAEQTKIIMFGFDQDTLSTAERNKVAELIDKLKGLPQAKLLLVGDTSSEGSDNYNHQLALRRIETVKQVALTQGFPLQRIESETYDELRHIANPVSGRQHRLIAIGQWQHDTVAKQWNIFSSEHK
ncbi:OmpA family protein [Shewanella waksmanii]|uniref:OmpA family protein n=1 Tax=Shewanella waksmanii TaxID=213783 RepID=UPI00048E21CA|nr:OmpA family protein [Shewanella waksmanii]